MSDDDRIFEIVHHTAESQWSDATMTGALGGGKGGTFSVISSTKFHLKFKIVIDSHRVCSNVLLTNE